MTTKLAQKFVEGTWEWKRMLIEEALNAFDFDWDEWVIATFDKEVVVENISSGKMIKYQYEISTEGEVTLSDPIEVEIETTQEIVAKTLDKLLTETAAKTSQVEGSWEWRRDIIQKALNQTDHDWSEWVVATFDTEVVIENSKTNQTLRYDYTIEDGEAILSDPVEVELETEIVVKGGIELTGPIVMKSDEKQIAYAAVLVPGELDLDAPKGEPPLTAAKIEEVAHGFMAHYRNVDVMHTLNNLDADVVESFLAPTDLTVKIDGESVILPRGTWIMATQFDDETWKAIKSGQYAGYSVMGVKAQAMKGLLARKAAGVFEEEDLLAAVKKTLLSDLGDDWIATHVSVVTEPAVPKAKWFALKSKERSGLFGDLSVILDGAAIARKTGGFGKTPNQELIDAEKLVGDLHERLRSLLSDATGEKSDDDASEENDVDLKELKTAIGEALTAALEPVTTRLDAVEKAIEEGGLTVAAKEEADDDAAADDDDDAAADDAASDDDDAAADDDADAGDDAGAEAEGELVEAVKAAVAEGFDDIKETLEAGTAKKRRTKSRVIPGGDSGAGDQDDDHRDSFGRSRRNRVRS